MQTQMRYPGALMRRMCQQIQTQQPKIAAQKNDPVIKDISQALHENSPRPAKSGKWAQYPLIRYRQLWPQLTLVDGIVCRKYTPGLTSDVITVPIISDSLCCEALCQCHLMLDTTALTNLCKVAYWVNMA